MAFLKPVITNKFSYGFLSKVKHVSRYFFISLSLLLFLYVLKTVLPSLVFFKMYLDILSIFCILGEVGRRLEGMGTYPWGSS